MDDVNALSTKEDGVWDSDIVVSYVELQSHYYLHFQTNTLGKAMNSLRGSQLVLFCEDCIPIT